MTKANKDVLEHIRAEHSRTLRELADVDPYWGKTTIGIREVLKAHYLLAEYFASTGEGLGGVGPKNINLLHSALSRQFSEFGGTPHWKDRVHACASLMYGLILNHPFYDANKRTAFLSCMLHLQKIGRTPTCKGEDFEDLTVAIADHKLDQMPGYGDIQGPKDDMDIEAVALFLKRNTRNIDLHAKSVTYKKLVPIIGKYGLSLQNPRHNRIDLVRTHDGEVLLTEPVRLGRIGFKSWTTEVSRTDLHLLRAAAGLDIQHGYDSQSFFYGVEGPMELIKKYQEPLRRLAYR